MNLRYEIVENYKEDDYNYVLIVYDEKDNITTYKYTYNIIEILENDNIIELLNRHIKLYDNMIKKSLLTSLSSKKEKIIRDYLYNQVVELGMKSFELVSNNKIQNELNDKQVGVIYNLNPGISDVKVILKDAKNYSKECVKVRKLVK